MPPANDKHEFAFCIEHLSKDLLRATQGKEFIISGKDELYQRIVHVLRLHADENVTIFNARHNAQCTIKEITKKEVTLSVNKVDKNTQYVPFITVFLPLLKKEALETALYNLAEMGVNEIQLLTTEKTHRNKISVQEMARFNKIIVAATEQSKNFSGTLLKTPIDFAQITVTYQLDNIIFFDPNGESFIDHAKLSASKKNHPLNLLIGPEGDLSAKEKLMLKNANVQFCKLTDTILRAHQAITLAAGIIRSL